MNFGTYLQENLSRVAPPEAVLHPRMAQALATEIQFLGDLSPSFREQIINTYSMLPKEVLDLLKLKNKRIVLSDVVTTVKPEEANRLTTPTIDDSRIHANQGGGVYYGSGEIIVAEYYLRSGADPLVHRNRSQEPSDTRASHSQWWKTLFVSETLRHEIGHGVDHALGWISNSPGFNQAWKSDIEALGGPHEVREKGLGYFLQTPEKGEVNLLEDGNGGRKEVFTELWARKHGGGIMNRPLQYDFPNSAKWMQEFLPTFNATMQQGPEALKNLIEDAHHPYMHQATARAEAEKSTANTLEKISIHGEDTYSHAAKNILNTLIATDTPVGNDLAERMARYLHEQKDFVIEETSLPRDIKNALRQKGLDPDGKIAKDMDSLPGAMEDRMKRAKEHFDLTSDRKPLSSALMAERIASFGAARTAGFIESHLQQWDEKYAKFLVEAAKVDAIADTFHGRRLHRILEQTLWQTTNADAYVKFASRFPVDNFTKALFENLGELSAPQKQALTILAQHHGIPLENVSGLSAKAPPGDLEASTLKSGESDIHVKPSETLHAQASYMTSQPPAISAASSGAKVFKKLTTADTNFGKTLAAMGAATGIAEMAHGAWNGDAAETGKGLAHAGISSLAFEGIQKGLVRNASDVAEKIATRYAGVEANIAKSIGTVAGKTMARALPLVGAGVVLASSVTSANEFEKQGRGNDAAIERSIGTVEAGLNLLSVPGVVLGDIARAGMNTVSRVTNNGSQGELSMIERSRTFLNDMRVQQDVNTKILGNLPTETTAADPAPVRTLVSRVAEQKKIDDAVRTLDALNPNKASYNAKTARAIMASGALAATLESVKPHIPRTVSYNAAAPSGLDVKEIKAGLMVAYDKMQGEVLAGIQSMIEKHPDAALKLYGKNDPALLARYQEGTADDRVVDKKTGQIEAMIVATEAVKTAEMRGLLQTTPKSKSIMYSGITSAKVTPDAQVAAKKTEAPGKKEEKTADAKPVPDSTDKALSKNSKTAEAETDKAKKRGTPSMHA